MPREQIHRNERNETCDSDAPPDQSGSVTHRHNLSGQRPCASAYRVAIVASSQGSLQSDCYAVSRCFHDDLTATECGKNVRDISSNADR